MKREDWKKVYQPRQGALEVRVRQTLLTMDTQRNGRTRTMKKTMALVLSAVLLLGAAAALAAGLIFSDRVDAQTAARQVLAAQYGFTPAMESFFDCTVSEDGCTVMFTPTAHMGAGLENRLGVYTVTIGKGNRTTAFWSHDGEKTGEDTQSPVWDTKLLAAAIARKAAGEEWIDIVLSAEQTAINVTPEEAIGIAEKAVMEKFDAVRLQVCEDWGAHLYYRSAEKAEKDGRGAKCYQVRFVQEESGTVYSASLYANSGEVFECKKMEEERAAAHSAKESWRAAPGSEQARALAEITPEQAAQLAKNAAAEVYGLSQMQKDSMEWIDDIAPSPYAMVEGTPVIQIYLWLWQDGTSAPYVEGDGVYQVEVNAQTGTIERILYDSTLSGNG